MITRNNGFGNTRSIPQPIVVHLDYLRIRANLDVVKFEELLEFLDNKYMSVNLEKRWSPGGNAVYFDNRILSIVGINGGFTVDSETGKVDVMIDMSGQYFSNYTVENQWRILRGLFYTFGVNCSRIDIAIDDYTKSIIPVKKMANAWEHRHNFGFKSYKFIKSGNDPDYIYTTHCFGSRDSGKFVRVYDKHQGFLRFETEFKRAYAPVVFTLLATIERDWFNDDLEDDNSCMDAINEWHIKGDKGKVAFDLKNMSNQLHGCADKFDIILQRIMGSIAVNAIDFRDRSRRKNRSKASYKDTTRLGFYKQFMYKVGIEIRAKSSSKQKSIIKTVAWMQRQVSKQLSIVVAGLGAISSISWVKELIKIGAEKQTLSDGKLIKYIKDNPDLCRLQN